MYIYRGYALQWLYSQGTGPILYENLNCTGHEVDLFDCRYISIRHHNCNHTQDVAVKCRIFFFAIKILKKNYSYIVAKFIYWKLWSF